MPAITCRFVVLQHDLYEVTVDMAIGYTLNAAQTHNPAFTVSLWVHLSPWITVVLCLLVQLEPIGVCNKIPTSDLYQETSTNATYNAQRKEALSHANDTTGSSDADGSDSTSGSQTGATSKNGAERVYAAVPVLTAVVAAGAALFL